MQTYQQEVNGIVGEIWSSMLGLSANPDDRAIGLSASDDAFVSQVSISGNWRGTVTIHCEPRLARDLAAVMFGLDPERTSAELIEDALGELANMTGGSFKSLLPEPCYLSLPSSNRPETDSGSEPNGQDLGRYGFNCLEGTFLVTLAEKRGHAEKRGQVPLLTSKNGT